ncbi:MAG TPA: TonB-dependent receptor [Bacteroidales bacterium]|nr:TonB-dependent receptor [Bacteroidales bacterium]
MSRSIGIFVSMIFSLSAFSQQLSGVVYDAKYDKPLADVNITITDESIGAKSNQQGYFIIHSIKSGVYRIRATLIGYHPFERKIEIKGGALTSYNIYLQPANIKLNDEVVISARRIPVTDYFVPEAITLIENDQLNRNAARTTPEALSGSTGVFVQKTNHGGGSPFIRGFTGNQNLMLIDGIRLNNATYRYGPNQYLAAVDPLITDRIEVVRGSGSVLYGSDAIGGVVQVFTRNPDYSTGGFKAGGTAQLKWMSEEMVKSARGEISLAGEKVAFIGGFTFNDFGDIVAGKDLGKESPTGYSGYSGDGKLRIDLGRENELIMAYQCDRQDDVPRYDKIITGYEKYHFDPQIRQLAYLQLHTRNENKWISKINYVLSFGQSDETRILKKQGQEKITTEQDAVDTYGGSVEVISQPSDNWSFISGIDYYYDLVGSAKAEKHDGVITNKRGYYPDGASSASIAFYSSHTYTSKKFTFNAGARLNRHKILLEDELFGDVDNTLVAFVVNTSVGYSLSDDHRVIGSVYSAFRAPNINDLSSFGSFNYGIEVPNPDLESEKSLTTELGYKVNSECFSGSFFVFQNHLTDLIERVPATWDGQDSIESEKVFCKENFALAVVKGIEVQASYRFTLQWTAHANLTYTYGQNETLDEPMTRIPPLFGQAGILYESGSGFWGQLEMTGTGKQVRLSSGDKSDSRIPEGGTPGWYVFNLRMGYSRKWVSINGGFINILDEAYRTHGSGVDGYGRSFVFGIKATL